MTCREDKSMAMSADEARGDLAVNVSSTNDPVISRNWVGSKRRPEVENTGILIKACVTAASKMRLVKRGS